MATVLIHGGDPCPSCGAELGYDESESDDGWRPFLYHPDPQCGWFLSSYPERVEVVPGEVLRDPRR